MILGKHHLLTLDHLKNQTAGKSENFEEASRNVLGIFRETVHFDSAWIIKFDPASLNILNIYLHQFNQKAFSGYLDFFYATTPVPTIRQIKNEGFISKKGSDLIENDLWIKNPFYKEILQPLNLHFFLSTACITSQQEYIANVVLWRSNNRHDFSTHDCFFMEKASGYCAELFKPVTLPGNGTEKPDILKAVSRRSSPGIIILNRNNEIQFINQEAKNIFTIVKSGKAYLSMTDEQRFMEKLYDIKEKVIQTLATGTANPKMGPVCEVFAFRGTTFICRGLPLEGKDIQQESIIILVETVKEDRADTPSLNGGGFMFTARERAVVNLIVQGLANKEISSELGIGIHTVKDHVKNIMEKLETHTRSGIVAKLMGK